MTLGDAATQANRVRDERNPSAIRQDSSREDPGSEMRIDTTQVEEGKCQRMNNTESVIHVNFPEDDRCCCCPRQPSKEEALRNRYALREGFRASSDL